MKNAKYLGNWWQDFHKIISVLGVIPRIPHAKYGGDLRGGKVEPLTPFFQKRRSWGHEIFCAVGGL